MKQSIDRLRGMARYRLVEYFANGKVLSEDFPAPDDREAIRRAFDVCSASEVELWRGDTLVERLPRAQAPREPRPFALAAVAPAIPAWAQRHIVC